MEEEEGKRKGEGAHPGVEGHDEGQPARVGPVRVRAVQRAPVDDHDVAGLQCHGHRIRQPLADGGKCAFGECGAFLRAGLVGAGTAGPWRQPPLQVRSRHDPELWTEQHHASEPASRAHGAIKKGAEERTPLSGVAGETQTDRLRP